MAKYRYGDRVTVNGKRGKVGLIHTDSSGDYIYNIRMDDGTLEMATENHVRPVGTHLTIKCTQPIKHFNINITVGKHGIVERCPICRSDYHTVSHPIHGDKEIWSDCLKCNKTKEQIEIEIKQPKPKEIENEDDDFGFFD